MKNIFTKTLTLIAFLSLSIGVWGDNVTNLNVVYTTAGCSDGQQSQYDACDSYSDKDKIITDSDFGWNKGKDDVCNRANGGEKDGYLLVKNDATACSRLSYTFGGGNLSFSFNVACKDHGTYIGPTVKIDGKSAKFTDASFANDNTTAVITASMSGVSAGQHTITIEFKGSDKFYFKELTMTEATPTTFTITYDANNATSGTVPAATVGNGNVTLATNSGNLARTGYTFSGWNTNSEGTGTSYEAGANYNLTANITLYAKWTEIVPPCTAPTSVSLSNGKTNDWGYFGGETITLTATPNGGSTPTGYQWYFNDNEISGAISDTYTINSCSVENGGNYKCKVITGDDCNCTSDNYGIKVYALQCYTNGTFTYNFTRDGNSKIGTLILAREANYYYEYKIATGSDYYGNDGRISRDVLDWTFEPNKANVKFDAGFIAGDYTFTINYTDNGGAPKLSVMYPRRSVFVGLCNDWKGAEAKYAIYYERKSNASDNGWTGWMSAPDCDNDTRVASDVPVWADKYVICRYNPSTASPGSWESGTLWGQTCDIDADASKNYYTNLIRWDNDGKYHGEWSTYFVETSYDVSAGHKIFFDNSTTKWSNVFFRIGRKCYSSKYDMTLVPGTQSLYQYSIPQWDNYVAFHVADNCAHEGDGKNIYDVRPGSYNIDNCTSFIKEAITEDFTITPTTTTSGGSLPNYYDYNKSYGMLTHNVMLDEVANGTIKVAYTDVAGSAQNMTSGSADLAHTCILTITFTPAQGHHATSFQVNGKDFTSDSQLILTEDITISATCAVNQHKVTINLDGGTIDDDSWTSEGGNYYKMFNFGSTISLPTPTKTGFSFNGWTPAVAATMPDADATYTATWKVDYCSKTKFIECEDEWLEDLKSKASEAVLNTGYYKDFSGIGFMDYKQPGGETFYFVHLGAATYEFEISRTNVPYGGHFYLYSTNGTGESVTYKSVAYKRISGIDGDVSGGSGSEGTAFTKVTISNITLSEEGDYLIGLNGGQWSSFDYIKITADKSVFCPTMYTVNFAANPSDKGTVTAQINGDAITSGIEVPENTVVVFTASNITSGYELVNWTDGSGNELAGAVPSFEQKITSNITVNANIEEEAEKYTVTVTPGGHGSITSGEGEYREGATVTIVTSPATNYKVGSATASNVSEFTIVGNNVSFTMPNEAVEVTIYFVFDEVHALIITPNSSETYTFGNKEGGATTFNISSATDPTGTFDHNVLKLEYDGMSGKYAGRSISKDAGYTPTAKATGFAFWYRTEKSDDGIAFCFQKTDWNQTKWQMQATNGEWRYYYWEDNDASNYAKNANFKIYMNGEDDGNITKYNSGTYYITEIQATNVTSQDPIVPPVNLTVEVSPNEGGSVTTYPKTTTGLVKGTEVTLTAAPADNYRFVNWTVGGEEVSKEAIYSRTVNATETITANFVRVYTLVVDKDEHITEVTGAGQYEAGAEVTVTATAAQGYKFTKWTKDNASGEVLTTTSSYTFNMPATDNYTVYANSEEDIVTYHITLGECTNGTIVATVNDESYDGGELEANTPVVLTPMPNEGYGFVKWQDDNTDNPRIITANAETQEITWTATFALQFTVTATYGQPGTSVTGGGEYPNGADVTLTANWTLASKDFTYGFKEWIDVTGVNLTDEQKVSNPLTFSMPFANVSMKATFAPVECVDTYIIQCEDGNASLIENDPKLTLKPFERCNGGGCKVYKDHYTGYHGEGYWDFKEASNMAMYYPVTLEPGTYSFTVWNTTDTQARGCWMYIYTPSETDVVLTYDGQNFKEAASKSVDFYNSSPAYFGVGGIISNIVVPSRQKVFIALYASDKWSAWDQIVITATEHVFCEEKDIETFTILSTEAKEIPVSGVKNLVVYEGGQATNEDDVEVFETVKYIRSITEANIDQWSTFAVPYTATKTQVSKDDHFDDIYPVWRMENGTEQAGYYFMEVLTDKNAEAIGQESRARWDMSYTQQPQKDSAYITMFPSSQTDGYFIGSEIFYIGDYKSDGGVTLTGSNNAFIEHGGWPEEGKPKYYYFPNSAITAIQPYDAYVLSEDGTEFVLTDHPIILPFQCYIQATTEFKHLYPRLVMRQNGGGTTDLIPVTADGWKVSGVDKVMIDEVIYIVRDGKLYSIMGQLVK